MSYPKKVFWLCLFLVSFFPGALSASPSPSGVIIPLYMEPGATWDTLTVIHERHPNVPIYAIINPEDGPGSSYDSLYADYINRLKSSGIKVLGYVYTSYGERPTQEVEADIQHHRDWYNVDGIFLDEMASDSGYENYYQILKNYSYNLGLGFVMGNPGIDTRPSYVGTVDAMIIYESTGYPDTNYLKGWHLNYDRMNWGVLVLGVNYLDSAFVNTAINYVGYMYITHDTEVNGQDPWDELSVYLEDLLFVLEGSIGLNDSAGISPYFQIYDIQGRKVESLEGVRSRVYILKDTKSGRTKKCFRVR